VVTTWQPEEREVQTIRRSNPKRPSASQF